MIDKSGVSNFRNIKLGIYALDSETFWSTSCEFSEEKFRKVDFDMSEFRLIQGCWR